MEWIGTPRLEDSGFSLLDMPGTCRQNLGAGIHSSGWIFTVCHGQLSAAILSMGPLSRDSDRLVHSWFPTSPHHGDNMGAGPLPPIHSEPTMCWCCRNICGLEMSCCSTPHPCTLLPPSVSLSFLFLPFFFHICHLFWLGFVSYFGTQLAFIRAYF